MKYPEKVFAFKINAFELVAANSSNYGESTWHRPPIG